MPVYSQHSRDHLTRQTQYPSSLSIIPMSAWHAYFHNPHDHMARLIPNFHFHDQCGRARTKQWIPGAIIKNAPPFAGRPTSRGAGDRSPPQTKLCTLANLSVPVVAFDIVERLSIGTVPSPPRLPLLKSMGDIRGAGSDQT